VAVEEEQAAALQRGRRLQFVTIGWNLGEVFVTIALGVAAGSLALVAFGLDSLVEVFASAVVVWYIADHGAAGRARRALRLVAIAFGLLGVYLIAAAVYNVVGGAATEGSPVGIAFLAVTTVVMFALAHAKRSVARVAGSEPMAAEAEMTFLDGCLAAGVLVALVLDAAAGLWWADPAAAALVAVFCLREAVHNWREADAGTA
jgi:divalent metal cation (Fe/Co/Zn/Cd) transporter